MLKLPFPLFSKPRIFKLGPGFSFFRLVPFSPLEGLFQTVRQSCFLVEVFWTFSAHYSTRLTRPMTRHRLVSLVSCGVVFYWTRRNHFPNYATTEGAFRELVLFSPSNSHQTVPAGVPGSPPNLKGKVSASAPVANHSCPVLWLRDLRVGNHRTHRPITLVAPPSFLISFSPGAKLCRASFLQSSVPSLLRPLSSQQL